MEQMEFCVLPVVAVGSARGQALAAFCCRDPLLLANFSTISSAVLACVNITEPVLRVRA